VVKSRSRVKFKLELKRSRNAAFVSLCRSYHLSRNVVDPSMSIFETYMIVSVSLNTSPYPCKVNSQRKEIPDL
jgi:hypothetical protein